MDFAQAAAFFDCQNFDHYDFNTSSWVENSFTGQIRRADDFTSIWNRPTRKRMMFTAPSVTIPSSVVRVSNTLEIYLVAHGFSDTHANSSYRVLTALHQSAGSTVHNRKTPVEVLGVKGWATESLVANTFSDVELRSVNESQESRLLNYGNYFIFTPSDTDLRRHDTLVLDGTAYYILESYKDSGMVCARATIEPDERVDFVYVAKGTEVYDTSTQTTSSVDVLYNTTGKIKPLMSQDLKNSDVIKDRVQVMLLESYISYEPKVNDLVRYLGKDYSVDMVQRDAGLEEWTLLASL